MQDEIIERIYEAAFVPDLWPSAIDALAAATASAAGSVLVFTGPELPPRFRTTRITQAALETFTSTEQWRHSERSPMAHRWDFSEFRRAEDVLTPEQLARDSVFMNLRALGLGSQASTWVNLPTGELVAFTLERWTADGVHSDAAIGELNGLRPHLSRAGLIAARLGLERARATVGALEAIGLPAAVMRANGVVLAANPLLESLPAVFVALAHGRLALADSGANGLFQRALAEGRMAGALVRSIPVPGREDRGAMVVHVMPLRRSAHEVFSGGDMLVAATAVSATALMPQPNILTGLFDLSPAEARLATALSGGTALKDIAGAHGIQLSTARSHLSAVMRKTGTNHQGQLVALLKSAQPIGR